MNPACRVCGKTITVEQPVTACPIDPRNDDGTWTGEHSDCHDREHGTPDMVNHPPHYGGLPRGLEVIDLTEHMTFSRGNAVKYLLRAGKKGGPEQEIEDLRKAAWYCTREADRLEGQR